MGFRDPAASHPARNGIFLLSVGGTVLDTSNPIPARPRVWLLVGEKVGDNAQVQNLARAVGWEFEERRIVVKPQWQQRKPWVRAWLIHVDRAASDPLEAPWPDLVITAGRRMTSVGLWVKRASGGRTRLVVIGRPRRLSEAIDLAVVAAQYALPEQHNVARHDLPLMHADPVALERARETWSPRLADLPRPLTALMVGGPTGGLRFDLAMAGDLLDQARATALASGGSLYVSTSRRTPKDVVAMLERECVDPIRLYVFDPDAPPDENPYYGLLALADHFVVTIDSMSMMVEVARLGRVLSLFALESERGSLEQRLEKLGLLRPFSPREEALPAGGFWSRTMHRLGWSRHSRDLSAIPRLLVDQGRAVWLGDAPISSPADVQDDTLERVARRIRAMWEPESGAGSSEGG